MCGLKSTGLDWCKTNLFYSDSIYSITYNFVNYSQSQFTIYEVREETGFKQYISVFS